jgi:hypothetical protein
LLARINRRVGIILKAPVTQPQRARIKQNAKQNPSHNV